MGSVNSTPVYLARPLLTRKLLYLPIKGWNVVPVANTDAILIGLGPGVVFRVKSEASPILTPFRYTDIIFPYLLNAT